MNKHKAPDAGETVFIDIQGFSREAALRIANSMVSNTSELDAPLEIRIYPLSGATQISWLLKKRFLISGWFKPSCERVFEIFKVVAEEEKLIFCIPTEQNPAISIFNLVDRPKKIIKR